MQKKQSKSDGASAQRKENITMENKNSVTYSPFYGCTIVATENPSLASMPEE